MTGGAGRLQVDGSVHYNVIVHELGHTFGLGHAGRWNCHEDGGYFSAVGFGPDLYDLRKGIPGETCPVAKYSDDYSAMGSNHFWFHSFHQRVLGSLRSDQVVVANRSGSYEIEALELAAGGVKQVKIPVLGKFFYFFILF